MSSRFCRRDYRYSSECSCYDFCPQRSFGGRVDNAQISIQMKDFAVVISRIQGEKSRNCDSNRMNKNPSTVPNTQRLPSGSFLLQIREKSKWYRWQFGDLYRGPGYLAFMLHIIMFILHMNWIGCALRGFSYSKNLWPSRAKWDLFNWFA